MKIRTSILLLPLKIILTIIFLFGYTGESRALDILAYIPQTKNGRPGNYPFSDTRHNGGIRNAMVKVYTTKRKPYHINPWTRLSAKKTNGSGCIIRGNMILTNAHVVDEQGHIHVRRFGESKKYQADILYISHEADLALLSVNNGQFFEDITPLEIGGISYVKQNVSIYGFPGKEELVITRGFFSKIEYKRYIHRNSLFPAGTIDASIKPGNSGSPVIVNNKIAGIVMQASRKNGTALMVPILVINYFLDDIEDGHYDGFPDNGLSIQEIDNSYVSDKTKRDSNKVLFQPISFL